MKKRKQEPGRVQFVRVESLRWWFVIIFLATGRSNGFYQRLVQKYWLADFPGLPSYNRYVELMSDALMSIAGISIVQINPAITSFNSVAGFNLCGKAGDILPKLYSTAFPVS